jgi:hypothetical protein
MGRRFICVLSLCLLLSACALRTAPVRIYDGDLPLDQVALISGYHEYVGENFPSLVITEIDQKRSSDALGYAVEAYVLPGRHWVKFRKINPSGLGWHSVDVSIDAKAGHTYMTRYKVAPGADGRNQLEVEVLDKGPNHKTGMTYQK